MIGNKYRSVFAADADLCLHELLCCICKCRGASASAEAASASAEAASARTLPYLQVQRRICKYRGCICKYRGCICKYRSVFVNVTCQQINTDLYLQQTQICACMNFCVVSASAEAVSASAEAASASQRLHLQVQRLHLQVQQLLLHAWSLHYFAEPGACSQDHLVHSTCPCRQQQRLSVFSTQQLYTRRAVVKACY